MTLPINSTLLTKEFREDCANGGRGGAYRSSPPVSIFTCFAAEEEDKMPPLPCSAEPGLSG